MQMALATIRTSYTRSTPATRGLCTTSSILWRTYAVNAVAPVANVRSLVAVTILAGDILFSISPTRPAKFQIKSNGNGRCPIIQKLIIALVADFR